MSYKTALVFVIVFLIPVGIFVVTGFIRLRRYAKQEQQALDMVFCSHKNDKGGFGF